MMNNIIDYHKEVNLFMRLLCSSTKARYSIIKYYYILPHIHDVYAPGQLVYGWAKMGKLIGDEGVMLIAQNRHTGRILYPVFQPVMAFDMLEHWQLPRPIKWSVYQDDDLYGKDAPTMHPINREMRNLLSYARLFVSMQYRMQVPLSYGFEETIKQIYMYPEQPLIGGVEVINRVIGHHLYSDGTIINCKHMQEFIAYLHNRYTLLKFVEGDFPLLRKLLAREAPGTKCFF
ncbi:MAG: hypothetical protein ACI3XH_02610 [Phascolarctobacterium sp.]